MKQTKKEILEKLGKDINKIAIWTAGNGLKFQVRIMDVFWVYGSPHYLVAPVSGSGQARVRNRLEVPVGEGDGLVRIEVSLDKWS